MDSAQVFTSSDGYLPLWHVTWDRINSFLPGLKEEFFKAQSSVPKPDELQGPIPGATGLVPCVTSPVPCVTGPVPINIPSTLPEPTLAKPSTSPPLPPVPPSFPTSRSTSIILQPPSSSYGHTYTTPIFNHLGQQVSTRIEIYTKHKPKLELKILIFQMMTTSISGQAPVSLVPSTSDQKPFLIPSIVPTIPVEPVKKDEKEEEIVEEEKPQSEAKSLPEVEEPIPATVLSISEEEPSYPEESPPQNILHHGNFGSRTSAFVPYVNLNNFIPHRTDPIIPSYSTAEPLYIPPTSNIIAPVQMYSTAGLDNEANKTWNINNNGDAASADSNSMSVLSQYFSQQNQVS